MEPWSLDVKAFVQDPEKSTSRMQQYDVGYLEGRIFGRMDNKKSGWQ